MRRRDEKGGKEKGEEVTPISIKIASILLLLLALVAVGSLIHALSQQTPGLSAQVILDIFALSAIPVAYGLWKQKNQAFYASLILLETLILISPLIIAFSPYFGIKYNWISLLSFIAVGLAIPPILISNEQFIKEAKPQALIKALPIFNAIFIISGIALIIRTVLPYDTVFKDTVRFASDDAVFHMRLVENALFGDHFPRRLFFDAYTYFPHGTYLHFAPLFDLIIVFATWIIGLGSPTKPLMEAVGAYYPAILGAIVVFPVYIIGREIYNKYAGLIASLVAATLPGQFLSRSIIGFTDHHVGEVLFSTVAVMFLILAIKRAKEELPDGTFMDWFARPPGEWIRSKNFPFLCYAAAILLLFQVIPWEWWVFLSFVLFLLAPIIFHLWKKPDSYVFYSIMAGMALGFYLLVWVGAVLFIVIFMLFGILQYTIAGLRGEQREYICITAIPLFLIPLMMILPFLGPSYPFYNIPQMGTLSAGVIIFAVPLVYQYLKEMGYVRGVVHERAKAKVTKHSMSELNSKYDSLLPALTLIVISLVSIIIFPSAIRGLFGTITPGGTALTIQEVHPMDTGTAWIWFTTTFYIAIFAMVILVVDLVLKDRPEELLMLVWSIIIFVSVGGLGTFGIEGIGQNRFAYYYAINVAVLSGLFSMKAFEFLTGTREVGDKEATDAQRGKRKGGKHKKRGVKVKRSERVISHDVLLTIFVFAIMIMFFAGIRYVGVRAIIPLAVIVAILSLWMHASSTKRNIEIPLGKTLAAIFIIFIVFFPFPMNALSNPFPSTANLPLSASYAINSAKRGIGADEDWYESLRWMRTHTPDPGVDYYALYDEPALNETTGRREDYRYPPSAYGVMSWWDYGHIITWIAHRIPNANPFQAGIGGPIGSGNPGACVFFILNNESKANEVADVLGVRYVVSDFMMADIWNSFYNKYGAMTVWAGDPQRYSTLSYYYRTMEARLHMFDGTRVNVDGETIPALAHYRLVHESPTFILPMVIMNRTTGMGYWRSMSGDYNRMNSQAQILHGYLFSMPTGMGIEDALDNGTVPGIMKGVFNSSGIPLSEDSIAVKSGEKRWTIRDDVNKNIFIVKEQEGKLNVYLYGVRTGQPDMRAWTPEYIQPVSFVKTFEYVKGARIEGTAPAGSLVEVSTNVTTNQGREFVYSQRIESNGTFSFIVPYSTEGPVKGGTDFDVFASPYKIKAGHVENATVVWDVEKEVHVPEEAVMEGKTISVDLR